MCMQVCIEVCMVEVGKAKRGWDRAEIRGTAMKSLTYDHDALLLKPT